MSITISLSNHKGGVGKTTSTLNIAAGLHLKGNKVLMVDLDAQANLTQSLGGQQKKHFIRLNVCNRYIADIEKVITIHSVEYR